MFETFLLAGGLVAGILLFFRLFARKRKPMARSALGNQATVWRQPPRYQMT